MPPLKSPDGFCIVARAKKNRDKKIGNGANLGFEEKLWEARDALRNNMDYKVEDEPRADLTPALKASGIHSKQLEPVGSRYSRSDSIEGRCLD